MSTWEAQSNLAKSVKAAGFLYDQAQDIIYSKHDAWQRGLGYCWGYDVASSGIRMIIDCETIYFDYNGSAWMIELWKGQYGLETGAEIGVYRSGTAGGGFNPRARFYSCASVGEQLTMTFTLHRNGQKLFKRGPESHWWLTGFRWGVFTRSTLDLSMDIEIEFPNLGMCRAVGDALDVMGYHSTVQGRRLSFVFHRPRTSQPRVRTELEPSMQRSNERLVDGYNDLKRTLRVTNNDPNAFAALDVPGQKAIQAVTEAATRVRHVASTTARKFQSQASAVAMKRASQVTAAAANLQSQVATAARQLDNILSEEADTAYRDIASFFDGRLWHVTREARNLS